MVRAQRRIMKRKDKAAYVDHEFSVAELVERGRKKRTASPAALEALARLHEKRRLEHA